MATVTAKLITIGGDLAPDSTVTYTLAGYGSQNPKGIGGGSDAGMFGDIVGEATDEAGSFTVQLIGNDLIYPPGTYYVATIRNGNGDVLQSNAYRFPGDGTYDLGNTPPVDPNLPPYPIPPPLSDQLDQLPFSPTPVFDGSTLTAWQIVLTGDVTSSTLTGLVPGNLYTFIILQDAVGGHKFAWPPNASNTTLVDPAPLSVTVQTYLADGNANLTAVAPGTYWP